MNCNETQRVQDYMNFFEKLSKTSLPIAPQGLGCSQIGDSFSSTWVDSFLFFFLFSDQEHPGCLLMILEHSLVDFEKSTGYIN
jgi:hypothetical protein